MIREAEQDYHLMVKAEENLDSDELFALGIRKEIARALAEINHLREEVDALERKNEHQRRYIEENLPKLRMYEILKRERESQR